MSEACCNAGKPVPNDYEGKGVVSKLGDLPVYEIGSGEKAVILAYDIFGFDIPNTRHVCDILADAGFRVIMPDYYRGKPWSLDNFPPEKFEDLVNWCMGILKDSVANDNKAVLDHLRKAGATKISVLGFCWGGKVAVVSGATGEFCAAASAHPAFLEPEDGDSLKCPMLFCPTGDDPPIDPIKNVLDKRTDIGGKCKYHRYEKQAHGFVTARGDWLKPETKVDTDDFIKRVIEFFSANMA